MADEVVSRSPQRPADEVVRTRSCEPADVAKAAQRGRDAFEEWSRTSGGERARAMERCADAIAGAGAELAALMTREVGKPAVEAAGEVARAVDICRYHAQSALYPVGAVLPPADGTSWLTTRRRPYGLAGLVTPWNFPLAIPLWKLMPALAAGNAVLWKPAPEATATALLVGELLTPLLADGLVTVLSGGGATGSAVLDTVDVISFTGSDAVGRSVRVAGARRGVPVQAETGGINASVVLSDADVERAAGMIAGAAMGFAGQKCTATQRVLVLGDERRFAEALCAAVSALPCGDPADPNTVIGPVISAAARARIEQATQESRAGGADVFELGTHPDEGYFHAPTVVVGPAGPLARAEVFGPICSVEGVPDEKAAVLAANATPFGLAAAVFTRDLAAAMRVVDGLDVGLVKVNAPTTGVDLHAPFGGLKSSGYGPHEQGPDARDHYSSLTTLQVSA